MNRILVLISILLFIGSALFYSYQFARFILFGFLTVIMFFPGWIIARHYYSGSSKITRFMITWTLFQTQLVITTELLGLLGIYSLENYVGLQLVVLMVFILFFKQSWKQGDFKIANVNSCLKIPVLPSNKIVLFLGCLLVVIIAMHVGKGVLYPPFDLDSLTYHLPFSVEWMKKGVITYIPTPFGANPTTYFPSNASLLFMHFISPLNSDHIVDLAQLPAFIISIILVYSIGNNLGLSKELSLFCAILFGLNPSVNREISSSLVDILMTSYFLMVIFFFQHVKLGNNDSFLVFAGLNLGCLWGTKTIGFVYSIPLFIMLAYLAYMGGRRGNPSFHRLLKWIIVMMFGAVSTSLHWYLKNWWITGNPVYPFQVKLAGIELFKGTYTKELVNSVIFHSSGWHAFIQLMNIGFGKLFFPVILISTVIACLVNIKTRPDPWKLLLFITPAMLVLLQWFFIPWNNISRFLIVATSLSFLPLAYIFDKYNKLTKYGAPITVLFVLYRFNGFQLAVYSYHWYIFGVGTVLFLLTTVVRKHWEYIHLPNASLNAITVTTTVSCILLLIVCITWNKYELTKYQSYTDSRFARDYRKADLGWKWIQRTFKKPINIAYTGNNLPYPLYGNGFKNNVYYVNINGYTDWIFHDYHRYYLEKNNGKLEITTPKPLLYRFEKDPGQWVLNLFKKNIDYVFVTSLHPFERYIPHDELGFPVEETWMTMFSNYFQPVYKNDTVHVYRFKKESVVLTPVKQIP